MEAQGKPPHLTLFVRILVLVLFRDRISLALALAGHELTACFLSTGIQTVSLCLPKAHFLSDLGIVVRGSQCAIQSDLELEILLLQLPECWDYRQHITAG